MALGIANPACQPEIICVFSAQWYSQFMKAIRMSDVLELPVAERLKLVEAIWDSIAEAPEALALTDSQRAELDRRLEDYESNPEEGSPWSEVKERILKRS